MQVKDRSINPAREPPACQVLSLVKVVSTKSSNPHLLIFLGHWLVYIYKLFPHQHVHLGVSVWPRRDCLKCFPFCIGCCVQSSNKKQFTLLQLKSMVNRSSWPSSNIWFPFDRRVAPLIASSWLKGATWSFPCLCRWPSISTENQSVSTIALTSSHIRKVSLESIFIDNSLGQTLLALFTSDS